MFVKILNLLNVFNGRWEVIMVLFFFFFFLNLMLNAKSQRWHQKTKNEAQEKRKLTLQQDKNKIIT